MRDLSIDQLVDNYEKGIITRRELHGFLFSKIDDSDVEHIISSLPNDLKCEFIQDMRKNYDNDTPLEGFFIWRVSDEEQLARLKGWEPTLKKMREWLKCHPE